MSTTRKSSSTSFLLLAGQTRGGGAKRSSAKTPTSARVAGLRRPHARRGPLSRVHTGSVFQSSVRKHSQQVMQKDNPFDAGYADNFPNIANIFETSPSIDTIARTKPAEFSVHNSVNSSRTATNGQSQHSPLDARSCGTGSGVPSHSPRQTRPRVAKQLNFSVPPSSRETAVSSRSAAAAAGWPTHAVAASTALKGDRGGSAGSGRGELSLASNRGGSAARDACMTASSVSAPCNAAVQTEDAFRAGAFAPVHSALDAGANVPPPIAHRELPKPSRGSGMPRSPSAPLLRQPSLPPQATDPSDVLDPSAQVPPLSERIDKARRMLLQPPTFEFSQYLRTLLQRWPQRPLVRSRLSELGLSPSKARDARPIGPGGFSPMDVQRSGVPVQYPPWLASPGPMAPPPPVQGVWPPYAYWPPPYPMPLPPAYWGPALPAWNPPAWHHAPPPPAFQPSPPPTPHPYYSGTMPPGALWGASSWPWPAASAFSTAALPGRRDLFKYVL